MSFVPVERSAAAIHRALEAWLDVPDDDACRLHLGQWRAVLDAGEPGLVIDVVLGIGEALIGDWRRVAAVAAANHAFVLGLDLLDNVADRELDPAWHDRYGDAAPDVATLAATRLFSCVPPLLLIEAGLSPAARAEAARLTALGLASAIRGQILDITSDPAATSPEASEQITALKTGAHLELVVRLPVLAVRDHQPVDAGIEAALLRFVVHLGIAAGLASDLADLFASEPSRDVVNGRPTQPLTRALTRLGDPARARLRELLAARDGAGPALAEIRELVTRSGSLVRCAMQVEVLIQRARQALGDAGVTAPSGLHAVLDQMSPLRGVAR